MIYVVLPFMGVIKIWPAQRVLCKTAHPRITAYQTLEYWLIGKSRLENATTWDFTTNGKRLAEAAIKFQAEIDRSEAISVNEERVQLAPRIITLTAPDALILHY